VIGGTGPAGAPPAAPGSAAAGKLERIWVKRAKLGPMDPRPTARLIAGAGIAGNADQGGRRQVTVIEAERWAAALAEVARDGGGVEGVEPSTRRANLLVSGIALAGMHGRVLRVGACRLLLHGETRPCERMERARAGLKAALTPDWRGGAYGEVIEGGDIAIGDPVALEAAPG
jgi:MOSC domain-containing protein YiiM